MKKALLMGGVALFTLTGHAVAADMPVKAYPQPVIPFVVSPFDGMFIGATAGYGWGNGDANGTLFGRGGVDIPVTGSGIAGGVHVGYNKTYGNFLLGGITEWDFTGINGNVLNTNVNVKLPNEFGTTRARVGYLISPNFAVYATGGVAYGFYDATFPAFVIRSPAIGWAGGVGAEYYFTPNWSAMVEYLHAGFGGPNISNGILNTSANLNLTRVGINWHF